MDEDLTHTVGLDWRIIFGLTATSLWLITGTVDIARVVGWGEFIALPTADIGSVFGDCRVRKSATHARPPSKKRPTEGLMNNSLTFYTNPMSRGRIVRWMLEEVGIDYETVYLEYGGSMKDAAYLVINPMGKVPAIRHGDAVVTECAAICAYLADAFPESGLAPPMERRADYYRWLFFAAGPVEAATTNRALGVTVSDDKKMMAGYGDFDLMRDTLIAAVSVPAFLCGEQFTAADVYLGSQVGWGLQFGSIPASPELEAYRDRCYARPAWQRANSLDDDALIALPDAQ